MSTRTNTDDERSVDDGGSLHDVCVVWLAGIWSVPCYVYFYTLGGYRDYIPYSWCFAYNSLTEFVPSTFHTASIWLTTTLAVQRYIYVCRALTARRLCTVPNFVRVIVAIFAAAVLSQVCRFFESSYTEVVVQSIVRPNQVRRLRRRRHLYIGPVTYTHLTLPTILRV